MNERLRIRIKQFNDIKYGNDKNETRIIPTVKLIFTDQSGAISGPNYPKNDPILSIYIKTGNGKFKPIAGDFLITSIKSNLDSEIDRESVGIGATYIMSGELYIPKIYNNFSKSYPNLPSSLALKELAADLDLGFSELDIQTSDSMTWINPNRNGLYFIDHIVKHAYLDEDSFFDSFIDKWYNLTFINVANQLVTEEIPDTTYFSTIDSSGIDVSQEMKDRQEYKDTDERLSIVTLTNEDGFKGRPEFITNYLLEGDIGRVLKSRGFRKKIYYYDHILDGEDKKTEFYVNSVQIKGESEDNRLVPKDERKETSNFITTKSK